jgi:tetratricopeptide (TPR) repeat protein
VRAVFSWSYRQLEPAAACVFRLLGVHPGHDVAEDAVAAMAGKEAREVRRVLDALVRANLVDLTPAGRYQPHDLLRFYAAELAADAGDMDEPLTRLFDHYLATACAAMDVIAPHEADRRPKTTGGRTFDSYEAAIRWLDADRANLLAVTQHADDRYICAMSDALWRYLGIRGLHDDAFVLHTRALRASQALGDATAEANARRTFASATYRAGHVSHALEHLERARDLYQRVGNRSLEAAAWNNIGIMHWQRSDLSKAADCFRHARTIYAESGEDRMRAPAVNNLAHVLGILGRHDEAHELYELGLTIAQDNGDRTGETKALNGLARIDVEKAHHRQALDRAAAALRIARDTGYRIYEGIALRLLGAAHRGLGEFETAKRHLEDALRITRAVGETDDLMATLTEQAALYAATGHPDEALLSYREVLAIENGHRDEYAHALAGAGEVHAARDEHDLAREHWERAVTVYREMGMPHADAIAAKLLTAPRRSAPPT